VLVLNVPDAKPGVSKHYLGGSRKTFILIAIEGIVVLAVGLTN
jgi:hypothetical protein